MIATKDTIRVCMTGAAGQIAYSLYHHLANGGVFGKDKSISLSLLDIPPAMSALKGVVMELEDCAFPLLKEIVITDDPKVAFKDADVILLIGSLPRKEGMQRKDLLQANAHIFESQGKAMSEVAKPTTKVIVVGNPANTNALIAQHFAAPRIPAENFTALTRLDQNRAVAFVASKSHTAVGQIKNVIIWGNHSNTQYPDLSSAVILHGSGERGSSSSPLRSLIQDESWVRGPFISDVQNRGAAVLNVRKLSSAMSAAKAIADHLFDWYHGTLPGQWVSMAVLSDGSYETPKGVFYSFPVTIQAGGKWEIVQGLPLDEFAKMKMKATGDELLEEKREAFSFLKQNL